MTFILRAQLDADAKTALALYQKYLERNKRLFPQSVLDLLENPDWQNNGKFGKYPHDGHLEKLSFDRVGKAADIVELVISKPWSDLNVHIKYKNAIDFDFPSTSLIYNAWGYDQFKFYNPYDKYGIKETNMFQHEIEWVGGVIWTVIAAEIEVVWKDI